MLSNFFVSLKIQTMFEMNDLVSEIYELSAVQFKMLTGGIANFGITSFLKSICAIKSI